MIKEGFSPPNSRGGT